MKKIDFKKDLKKMALAGIMSGAMLISQSAGAVQVSSNMDNYIAAAKCGAGCGGSPSPSYKSGCGGQPTSSSSPQRNPRLSRQIAENDIFSEVEAQKSQETPAAKQSTNQAQKPASSAWQNQKGWESSQKPSNGHSCSGKSGCSSSNGSYQNTPKSTPVQGQPQSYNQRPSNRQIAEMDTYSPSQPTSASCAARQPYSQPSASCAARQTYSQPSASCAARQTYSQPSASCAGRSSYSSCSGKSSCRAPTSGSGCAGR